MSRAHSESSKSNGLTESGGVIASKEIKNIKHSSSKNKKSVTKGMDRQEMIATAAYYRAEYRGFSSGNELQDWLDAEREIDNRV